MRSGSRRTGGDRFLDTGDAEKRVHRGLNSSIDRMHAAARIFSRSNGNVNSSGSVNVNVSGSSGRV
ncbi:MAG: hypothetical protein ACETV0_00120 [Nitrososphaeria archaeon]